MKARILGNLYLRWTKLAPIPWSLPNMPEGKTLEPVFSGPWGLAGQWNYPNPHPDFTGPPRQYTSYLPLMGTTFPAIYLHCVRNNTDVGPRTNLPINRWNNFGGVFLLNSTGFYTPTTLDRVRPRFTTIGIHQGSTNKDGINLGNDVDDPNSFTTFGASFFRRWTITVIDRWNDGQTIWENITTEKHYQFVQNVSIAPHIAWNIRWFVQNGLEHSIGEATQKSVRVRHFVMATQTRQYTIGAAGIKRPLLSSESNFGWRYSINEDINTKPWRFDTVDYPTIGYVNFAPRWLPDFFADIEAAQGQQLETLISVGLNGTFNSIAGPGVAARQSCIQRVTNRHLLKYAINPNYQAFNPRWVGFDTPAPSNYFTYPETVDYRLTNPDTVAQFLDDTITDQPLLDASTLAIANDCAIVNPVKSITTKSETWEVEHNVQRIQSWTSTLPITIASLGTQHNWRIANSTFDGQPVQFLATVENWLGPRGLAAGNPANTATQTPVEAAGFNLPPGGQSQTFTSINGQPVAMQLNGSDPDSNKAWFIIDELPQYSGVAVPNWNPTLVQNEFFNPYSKNVTWIPPQGWRGTTTFTYRVFDGFSFSPPIVVTLVR